jgi:hypothetical protein
VASSGPEEPDGWWDVVPCAGRERNLDTTAAPIHTLHSPQLLSSARLSAAYGLTVRASVALLRQFNTEIADLEAE